MAGLLRQAPTDPSWGSLKMASGAGALSSQPTGAQGIFTTVPYRLSAGGNPGSSTTMSNATP